jgi:hypothetical protein
MLSVLGEAVHSGDAPSLVLILIYLMLKLLILYLSVFFFTGLVNNGKEFVAS